LSEQSTRIDDFRSLSDALIASLRASGAVSGIEVGELAPKFDLPNATGNSVSLDDRLTQGPVVLSFYRGAWCPYCSRELHELQEALPQIHSFGASLIAINPQAPDDSLGLVEKLGLAFEVLSDLDQSVIRAYRLSFDLSEALQPAYAERGLDLTKLNANGSWSLPVPATFVIDVDGIVRSRHVDPNYRERMAVSDILSALARLT